MIETNRPLTSQSVQTVGRYESTQTHPETNDGM